MDASLLLIPLIGFLPATDPRVLGTVTSIQKYLVKDGFVARYNTDPAIDGLPPGEGAFLACSFWLADNLALQDRHDEARALFRRLLDIRNDVGLLSEGYDPGAGRLVGNFPQAFSHVGLVNTARNLSRSGGPGRAPAEKLGIFMDDDRSGDVCCLLSFEDSGDRPVAPTGLNHSA